MRSDTTPSRRDIVALFCFDWDCVGYERLAARWRVHAEGFDLFSFPSNVQLACFDLERFAARVAARYRGRIQGVTSNNEQFGALAAALVAERLGLPGTRPEAIVRCQHKTAMRALLEQVAPEANLPSFVLDCEYGEPVPEGLAYPLFVKPVKAAFSVLARRVDTRAELQAHTRFGPLETWIIRRLVAPFDRVATQRCALELSAHRMLCEQHVECAQFNLDGYVFDGRATMLGVVDAIMYPDTNAFLRFAYPSRLDASVQARALEVASRFLAAADFRHGMFNMEFFYDAASDALKVIEFNPRLASQLADLYLRVDGVDLHAISLALACGDDPALEPRVPARGACAASFVFRGFDERAPARLALAQLRWLDAHEPEAILMEFPRGARARRRDLKWLSSHRWAVLNMHGSSLADLRARYARACEQFGWLATW